MKWLSTATVTWSALSKSVEPLASIAFNTRVSLDDVQIEGIQNIGIQDIEYAEKLGYVIKLLAVAKNDPENGISISVRPTMLPKSHPLASVNDVFNAIFVTGDALGDAMFMGRGAGRYPTASAVCGDIIDAARNLIHHEGNRVSCTCFEEKRMCSIEKLCAPCYIRMQVTDQPGALAAIAAAFGAQNVSLRSVVQSRTVDGSAELVFITHSVSEYNLQMALQILKVLPVVKEVCSIIRVEDNELE